MNYYKINIKSFSIAYIICTLGLPYSYAAVSINDNLTGASSSYDWQALNGACLTAGNNTGSIPACAGLNYYSGKTLVGGSTGRLPDDIGSGALRLTNGDTKAGTNGNNQTGAVYSKFSFPSNSGVDITFKTVTYGGNAYANHANKKSGADGIAFFLTDANKATTVNASTKLGAFGGSLGYSCANGKDDNDGLFGAYIGLGIDEFGNFSNGATVNSSGSVSVTGDNTSTGVGQGWNRVTLRGAGDVNWEWLSKNKPEYYPTSVLKTKALQQDAVKKTCASGFLWNYSRSSTNPTVIPKSNTTAYAGFMNYGYIAHAELDRTNNPIFNQQAMNLPLRSNATPITYNLKITQDGLLSLSYSYNGGQETQVLNKQSITQSNGPLPSAFRFGFSSGTGGGSNVHEIMCFKAEQISGSASSSAGNVPAEGRVQVGSQVYLASYHPRNWWGQLTAQNLVVDSKTDAVSINPVATWDASCKLTGGACESTNQTTTVQTSRKLLTHNGTAGVSLDYDNLTSEQRNSLGAATDATAAENMLRYLKGDRSNERNASGVGTLRARDSVLGDIINSSPTWVGAPNSPYKGTWKNMLHATQSMPEGSKSYTAFASSLAQRSNVVYVGSNDGFMHGFRAGKTNTDGSFDSSNNDGYELMGYMPSQVLRSINSLTNTQLTYGSTGYAHNAYVDATPGTGDIYFNGAWHTWLAGGLGAGGNVSGVVADNTTVAKGALYVLDITEPDRFATTSASALVKGEWNSDTIICVNDTAASKCADSLGSTYGIPLIRRLHDGNWGVIFPNGQNSKSGKSGIFVMTVDQTSGNTSFRFIEAGLPVKDSAGNITFRNGISQVTAVDLDGDHISDFIYAGDMRGNVWRFDLTSDSPGDWTDTSSKSLIFNAGQPISTAIAASSTTKNEIYRVILNFGTGKIYPQSLTSASYTTPNDYFIYGLWDSDMSGWNGKSIVKYESLASASTITSSELVNKTITEVTYTDAASGTSGLRTVSGSTVCWKGSTTCGAAASANSHRGWKMELPQTNEQIVYNPSIQDGFVIFNTTVPEVAQVLTCDLQAAAGFTMALLPDNATPTKSYFKNFPTDSGVVAGVGASGTGSPITVNTGSKKYILTQNVSGKGSVYEVDPSANSTSKRITWIRRR